MPFSSKDYFLALYNQQIPSKSNHNHVNVFLQQNLRTADERSDLWSIVDAYLKSEAEIPTTENSQIAINRLNPLWALAQQQRPAALALSRFRVCAL